ncbi:MAG: 50S ribosomal protein L28 [Bacteroidales bacterium]|jgi:large subunit ribosomal protein L28|nr:50S ribosomal protein L28 [Bacteroidales bacterium]MDD3700405.1 50S ribosomal protein L28 [Bacteroidales bacterium]MDY0368709.1 50S ribosomal protein L28 [Bacteroidales bacterium]
MSKVCQITGKKVISGNKVSHSNRKTRRTFEPNLQIKKFYIPETDEWVVLKVSAAGIRTINKKGIYKALVDAANAGHLYRY